MSYPCIPKWMKAREKDPFDYPLRSRKEIAFEQYMNPPLFTVTVIKNNYMALSEMSTLNVHKADCRNSQIIIEGNIEHMNLTPLQKKRLIFLLGRRWKNDGKVKIVARQYTNMDHNLSRGFDIFRQLYWEAKRAPMYIWAKMKNSERRAATRRVYGNMPVEKVNLLKKEAETEVSKQMDYFNRIYDSGDYTPKFIKDNIQKHLDLSQEKLSADELKQKEEQIMEAERKAEELLARDNIEKNLVKIQILSKKAYETFFSKDDIQEN